MSLVEGINKITNNIVKKAVPKTGTIKDESVFTGNIAGKNNQKKDISSNENLSEKEANKILDEYAINQLKEIVSKYSNKKIEELTDKQIEKILEINRISTNLEQKKTQLNAALQHEGLFDNAYNFIKNTTGIGIAPNTIENNIKDNENKIKILSDTVDSNAKDIQKSTYEQLKEDIKNNNLNSQELTNYFGSKEKTLKFLNSYISKNKDYITDKTNIKDSEKCKYVFEDNEYKIKYNDTYVEFDLIDALKKNDENIKNYAPKSFEEAHLFLIGQKYDFENFQKYEQDKANFDILSTGLMNARIFSNEISAAKTIDEAYQSFLEQCNGDDSAAIELFNGIYEDVLNTDDNTIQSALYTDDGSKITSLKIQTDKSGNNEFVFTFDGGTGNSMPENATYTKDENGNLKWEYVYNPNKDGYLTETNSLNRVLQSVNYGIKESDFFEKKYTKTFEAQYGLSVDEVVENYGNSSFATFGNDEIQEIINKYKTDMNSYSSKISTITSLGCIVGSFFNPVFGIGILPGIFSDNVIDGVNMGSNKVEDDYGKLIEDTATETGFVLLGMGINHVAQGAHAMVSGSIMKNSGSTLKTAETLGTLTEVVVDGFLSTAVDITASGNPNLEGNFMGILIDIASGIRGYQLMQQPALSRNSGVFDDVAKETVKSTVDSGIDYDFDSVVKDVVGSDVKYDWDYTTKDTTKITEDPIARMHEELIDEKIAEGLIDNDSVQNLRDIGIDEKTIYELVDNGSLDNFASQRALETTSALHERFTDMPADSLAKFAAVISENKDIDISKLETTKDYGLLQKDYAADGSISGIKHIKPDGNVERIDVENLAKQRYELYQKEIARQRRNNSDLPKHIATKDEILMATRASTELYTQYLAHGTEAAEQIAGIFRENSAVLEITSRPKSENSTYTKIINTLQGEKKLKGNKIDITNLESCKSFIEDAYGSRIQIKNLTEQQHREIVENYIKDNELDCNYEDYLAVLNGTANADIMAKIDTPRQNEILNLLKEKHTDSIVDNLVKGIKNKSITIANGEFNNYGTAQSTYFTPKQLEKIADAYHSATGEKLTIISAKETGYNGIWQARTNAKGEAVSYIETEKYIIDTEKAIKASGYTTSQFNIMFEFIDGSTGLGEIQIRGPEVNDYGDIEHGPYDIKSGKYDSILDKNPEYVYMKKVLTTMNPESAQLYNKIGKEIYGAFHKIELGYPQVTIPTFDGVYKDKLGNVLDMSCFNVDSLRRLFGKH